MTTANAKAKDLVSEAKDFMSDYRSKIHQNRFWLGLSPGQAGESLQCSSDFLAEIKGPTSKGREKVRGGERDVREVKAGEGKKGRRGE